MRATAGVLLSGFLVCLALGLASRATAAEDWKYVAMSGTGDRYFYDASSVIPLSGREFQLWTKKLGADGSSSRILSEVNCSYKIIRDLRRIVEIPLRRGRPDRDIDRNWRAMELDPATLELFKILCR
jgi:hypothetical protein